MEYMHQKKACTYKQSYNNFVQIKFSFWFFISHELGKMKFGILFFLFFVITNNISENKFNVF